MSSITNYAVIPILALILVSLVFSSFNIFSIQIFPSTVIVLGASSSTNSFWTTGTNMPTPRSEIGVASLNGKIYVVGGQDVHAKKLDVVEVYDPGSDKWHSVAPLPHGVDHSGVTSYNGKLYVVGGSTENSHTSNKLFIYDPIKNKWQEGEPMPTSRTMLTADFVNGILYAVGGVNSSYSVVATNEAYNPKSNSWTERMAMPTPRQHATSEVVNGKLYIIGGRVAGDGKSYSIREALLSFNNNEVYDPNRDTWSSLQPMPTNRSSMTAASINDYIYVFGGQSRVKTPADILVFGGRSAAVSTGDSRGIEILFAGQSANGTLNNNERYDTKTNSWTSEIPITPPRLGLESVALNDRIYLIGGKPSLGNKVTGLLEIFHPHKP